MSYKQTVELAIATETGECTAAADLLTMSEADFSTMRRTAMENRGARRRNHATPKFVCAICNVPVYLTRHVKAKGNRWFVHDGASMDCPWYEGNRLSADMRRALIYRGQQEGAKHRQLKEFVASCLEREPGVTRVDRELVTHGQILKGEWKRPDVQCVKDGRRIVFEIQLSYTFLSEVIKRDDFYRQEGIFIIWLFSFLDLKRSTVLDEAFFNRRNVFVLDPTAIDESLSRARLTFNGMFQQPELVGDFIEDEWQRKFITLDDVHFPTPSFRPYFFDYDAARRNAEAKQVEERQRRIEAQQEAVRLAQLQREQQEHDEWNELIQRYLTRVIAYYDSDYAAHLRQPVFEVAAELLDHGFAHAGYESLRDENFMGWHRILPVLLSIKHDRPIGYKKFNTAYQVLEAGVRQTFEGKNRAFAVPYLWASYIYKPTLNQKQRQWRIDKASEIKSSIESGETVFQRVTGYDETIELLFPELTVKLSSRFATDQEFRSQIKSPSWRQPQSFDQSSSH